MRRVLPLLFAAVLVGPAAAVGGAKESFPAAGELRAARVVVRSAPDPGASAITVLRQFRADFRRQIVFAETKAVGKDRRTWYRIRLTHRPNGTLGWIPKSTANLSHVTGA